MTSSIYTPSQQQPQFASIPNSIFESAEKLIERNFGPLVKNVVNSYSKPRYIYTNKKHLCYDISKHLLAYRFQNKRGHVKTAYLDRVFEGLVKNTTGSINDTHEWYYVLMVILQQYVQAISKRNNCNLYEYNFYMKVLKFYFKYDFSNISSIRRDQVAKCYYFIFDQFNQYMDVQNVIQNPKLVNLQLTYDDLSRPIQEKYIAPKPFVPYQYYSGRYLVTGHKGHPGFHYHEYLSDPQF